MVPMHRVVVEEVEEMTAPWPTGRVSDFKKWLDERVARVPVEYQSEAKIRISHDIFDGEPYVYLQISYDRPETEQEFAVRMERVLRERSDQEKQEFQLFLTLKEKYEDHPLNPTPSYPSAGL